MYIVNDLTIPSVAAASESIEVNVFVSAGQDMQFRNPTSNLDAYYWFPEPQSGEELLPQSGEEQITQMDKEDTEEPSKPMQETATFSMMDSLSDTDATDHVFFGESIVSIRSMLKRYARQGTFINTDTAGFRLITHIFNSFPYYPGYAKNAITPVLGNTEDYNFGHNSYINYFTPAYRGWRGGIRWKLNPVVSQDTRLKMSSFTLVRDSGNNGPYETISTALSGVAANMERTLRINASEMLGGGFATNSSVNPCMEVEVPFQERQRFLNAREADYTSNQTTAYPVNLRLQTITNSNTSDILMAEKYVSVGEDFFLFFFIGAPIMYNNVPVPSL